MQKPRVIVIDNSIDVTGAATSIARTCEVLRDSFEFMVILPSGSKAIPLFESRGFEVTTLPMREIRRKFRSLAVYLPYLLINARRLRTLLNRKAVDLVVNNDFYNLLPVLCCMVPGRKVPYICFVRFLPSKFPARLVQFWCRLHDRYAAHIVAVSNAVKKELPFKRNVSVVYNQLPADATDYQPSASKVLLYPSNYIEGKGQNYALESFARIAGRFPDWKLIFVGSDMGLQKNTDFKTALMNRAVELGLTGRVVWHGRAKHMAPLYQQAGLVLNFSESESFSLTCLEALFYGRPLIATDCGGPAEIIDTPETGLLVPVGDIDAMTNAMETLLADEPRRQRMGETAYQRVRTKFSDSRTVRVLGEIFSSYIGIKKQL